MTYDACAQRDAGKLTGNYLRILRLMQRARGPVTVRLFRYELYTSRGRPEPDEFGYNISHLRTVTGLGIRNYGQAGYGLVPELNEPWCEPEKWEEKEGD